MANRVTVTIPKHLRQFETIVRQEFTTALRRAGEGFYKQVGRQFELSNASASGKTFKSIKVGDIKVMGDRASIEVGAIGDRAFIMAMIEHGRHPGKAPPPEPIKEWLFDRKIVTQGDDPKKINALVWYISRQIAQFGIEPKEIFGKARRTYRPHARRIFQAATRRVVKRLLNGTGSNGQASSDGNTLVA